MSLTNPNKPVTEARLAEFYQQILPYLGGMPEALANKFDKANLYSTDEKIIGCWTDGRPIYQKTVSFGALPNASEKTYNHGITNIKEVIHMFGVAQNPSNYAKLSIPDDSNTPNSNGYGISVRFGGTSGSTQFAICTSTDLSSYTNNHLTIQYTKTSDSANSFKYGNETDYSTDEHIIGTWINGKPIYQKTFSIGALSNVGTTNTTTALKAVGASVDKYIWAGGYIRESSGWQSAIPYVAYSGNNNFVVPSLYSNSSSTNKNSVGLLYAGNLAWITETYLTIQYTKTTD